MDPDASVASSAKDTTPASPGRAGSPRTFLGAIAVVGASACIVALLLVLARVSFWDTIGIPVIIVAALLLLLMHVFARIGRGGIGNVVVGSGYVLVGATILGVSDSNGTALVPGPALLAAVAFLGGLVTLVSVIRAYLRARRPNA